MSKPTLPSPAERNAAMAALPDWAYNPRKRAIHRSFTFADFNAAFAFMTQVARLAEEANHHPDWSNSWNRVEIALTTHEAGGVTARDITLARSITLLAGP